MKSTLAMMLLAGSLASAAGAETAAQAPETSMPGSVFIAPETGRADLPPEEVDQEITTDIDFFIQKGFTEPNWATHTAQVQDVLRDVVLPDWRKRSGQPSDPMLPSIDVAGETVLGGDYNDLLVMSRLPGDCDEQGCLFQLYSLVNDVWVKRFEFKTVNFAWKRKDDDAVQIGRVGGMWVPSATYLWKDGTLYK